MKQNQAMLVHNTTEDELVQKILKGVDEKFLEFERKFNQHETNEWLTRKEVSELLSVSLVTISEWSKKKLLIPYKIGKNRIRFKKSDIEHVLNNSINE
jgi:excisionase family DNA binding protein